MQYLNINLKKHHSQITHLTQNALLVINIISPGSLSDLITLIMHIKTNNSEGPCYMVSGTRDKPFRGGNFIERL